MSPKADAREKPLSRYAKLLGVTLLAGIVGGLASGIVTEFMPQGGLLSIILVAATVSLTMGLVLWASLGWWKGIDEAAQEAHKWAFWWGATVGLCLAGVVLLTLLYGAGDLGEGSVEDAMMMGAGIVVGCQMLGYVVAWVVWWLKRR